MSRDLQHRAVLNLIRRIIEVPLGCSKDDLAKLKALAAREHSSLVPIITEYLKLAERATTPLSEKGVSIKPSEKMIGRAQGRESMPHLFDLLREKRLFPLNSDLSDFASRVLPNMRRHRFNKMSRGDIAARIIEYLETRDPKTRQQLEASMRDAMQGGSQKPAERRSFFSKWEKIIKGIEL